MGGRCSARTIASWSGVSENTWVENSKPFEGRRGVGWALPGVQDDAAWGLDFFFYKG